MPFAVVSHDAEDEGLGKSDPAISGSSIMALIQPTAGITAEGSPSLKFKFKAAKHVGKIEPALKELPKSKWETLRGKLGNLWSKSS